jgi:hypothetical protein
LNAVYFLFAAGRCTAAYSKKIADFMPANTATPFNITFHSVYQIDGNDYVGNRFSVVALYDPAGGGVSLGFDPAQARSILAQSPAPGFTGPWTCGYGPQGWNASGVDESVVAAALQSGTYGGASLDDSSSGGLYVDPNSGTYGFSDGSTPFFSTISTDASAPAGFTLLNFSGASAGGTGFAFEVVPEPAAWSLLAAGTTLLLVRRRR